MICVSVADPNVCSDLQLLQFPSRYLEWIMVAREHSLDPTFNLDFDARADSLTEDERREVLSVRTWPFWQPWPKTSATFLKGSVAWRSSPWQLRSAASTPRRSLPLANEPQRTLKRLGTGSLTSLLDLSLISRVSWRVKNSFNYSCRWKTISTIWIIL